ncbi:Gfo/Idh/MocA family protein [Pseudocitrobacter corydidari]|uniref:Scyllo-inositol 2-dehydrogenase (NAD(+)) n=1 Tax=Pseudocitrobacter corydidari TaxID=2891570 RepID=A0ABY3S6H3_9ENTR|nr:Gfo/Idh/MocA family oxidoreductase [Pseudocitrobacter corydidari]UGS41711.1 scyllo-inositol 2-dehydrogenase (NAD(+)) [Pseudocitrobacter corydidari]
MNPTRLAVIGAGAIGRKHIDVIQHASDATLVALADPSEQARELATELGVAWFADVEEMLDEIRPDGVINATPNTLHVPCALACVTRGIPVLVEKPVAESPERARELVDAALAHNVPVLVGHHRRHNALTAAAKTLIDSGKLGNIVAVSAHWLLQKPDDYFDVSWRREPGAGPLLVNLVHDIDLMRYLLGEIEEVQAMASSETRGFANEDSAVVNMRFARGTLGSAVLSDCSVSPWSWEMNSAENPIYAHTPENCYLISGTLGALAIPQMRWWRYGEKSGWHEPLISETLHIDAIDPFILQLNHFIAVIRGEATPIIDAADALRSLEVIDEIRQAI